jgi:hypothetical protein
MVLRDTGERFSSQTIKRRRVMEVLSIIAGIVLLGVMGIAVFIGAHVSEEQRQGKRLPLPWEKNSQ